MAWNFEKVAGPFQGLTGGVVWDGQGVIFSAVKEERILRFDPKTGKTENFRRWSGRTNGLAIGSDGAFYGAQEGGRRVIQFMPDGSTAPTEELIDNHHHNQPTDLVVDGKGCVWFADAYNATPPYGPAVFPFLSHASVLRLYRDEHRVWRLQRMTTDTRGPRALLLSEDETMLYVADGDAERNDRCELRAYSIHAVKADGSLGAPNVLHAFAGGARGIEGLSLTSDGNIVACGGWKKNGAGPMVYVFSSSGAMMESIPLPFDMPMRCAFGDDGLASLYLTAGDGCLYRATGMGRQGLRRTR